jgi:AcrR family transcriptional regulator
MAQTRPVRADAQRNRDRILSVAAETFAAEGLSVPVHEIARRAGVGTGTVSRHFPTKEALFAAVLADRMTLLARQAADLAAGPDQAAAFRAFFALLAHEGAAHRGLAESLADHDLMADADRNPTVHLRTLLVAAQQAGQIRTDLGFPEVKALLDGCLSAPDAALDPMIDTVLRGLATPS